jgi:class 3 adenylate cyclase
MATPPSPSFPSSPHPGPLAADCGLDRQDLLALLETANDLTATETLQEALTKILVHAGRLLDSPAGSVILYSPERDDLYFAAATGPASGTLPDIRIPVGKGKAGEVFATGTPVVENRLADHFKKVDEKTDFVTRSMVCVPLRHREKMYGVMQMLNKAEGTKPYDQRDLELLTRFGVQATIAIHNARLFEQMLASSGLYATPAVRGDLIEQMVSSGRAAVRERFTVLFVDMRGFSQLCSMISRADRIQSILSDYVVMLSALVVKNEGIVNKVVGDGMVAIFRTRAGATNAVHTALEMLDGFARLRDAWNETTNFSLDFLDIGIGVATDDEMLLGTVGDDTFRDFSVIGPAVNLAAALVQAARDGSQILSDTLTFNALQDRTVVSAKGPIKFQLDKPGPLLGLSYSIYKLGKPQAAAAAEAIAAEPGEAYDVFFSYRREGGSNAARSVLLALNDEFRVFIDVDRLGSGHFDTNLLRSIESSPSFVVFLSPGALDRCSSPDDWLRKEIAHALEASRNIVPVTLPGFVFPDKEALPEDIREIVRHDGVEYSHRYFYAMIDKIKERLRK